MSKRKNKSIPYGKIAGPEDLGNIIRLRRKEYKADQAAAAGLSGVGIRFLSELERGKPTAELGKALQVMKRLGLEVWVQPRGTKTETEPNGGRS